MLAWLVGAPAMASEHVVWEATLTVERGIESENGGVAFGFSEETDAWPTYGTLSINRFAYEGVDHTVVFVVIFEPGSGENRLLALGLRPELADTTGLTLWVDGATFPLQGMRLQTSETEEAKYYVWYEALGGSPEYDNPELAGLKWEPGQTVALRLMGPEPQPTPTPALPALWLLAGLLAVLAASRRTITVLRVDAKIDSVFC